MIRSPSSTTRSRSTPCVAGCWGPMLSTMSAVARPPAPMPTSSARWPVSEVTSSVCRTGTRGPASAAGERLAAGGPAVAVEARRAAAGRRPGRRRARPAPTERVCSGSPAATQWCSRKVVPSRTGMSKVFLSFWLTYRFDPTFHDVTGRPCFATTASSTFGSVQRSSTSTSTSPVALGAGDQAEVERRGPSTSLVGALTLPEAVLDGVGLGGRGGRPRGCPSR